MAAACKKGVTSDRSKVFAKRDMTGEYDKQKTVGELEVDE